MKNGKSYDAPFPLFPPVPRSRLAIPAPLVHSGPQLILLSRIDGDALRAEDSWRWRFGWFESRLILNFRSAPVSTRTRSFADYRYFEASPIRSFFHSQQRERYLYTCL